MRWALRQADGEVREVEVHRDDTGGTRVVDGDLTFQADVQQVTAGRWSVLLDDRSHDARVTRDGPAYTVEIRGRHFTFDLQDPARAALGGLGPAAPGAGRVVAPMPGRVVRVLVEPGQKVSRGDGLVVVEAMKMENELSAPGDGVVTEVPVAPGDTVEGGALLVVLGEG